MCKPVNNLDLTAVCQIKQSPKIPVHMKTSHQSKKNVNIEH
jgi:3-deoxy-D-arabino-heptulosonate 7-phosphate (DAHP) synthase